MSFKRNPEIENQIFFLSKYPSKTNGGVLKEKISLIKANEIQINYKLHLMLTTICCARPLNVPLRTTHLNKKSSLHIITDYEIIILYIYD